MEKNNRFQVKVELPNGDHHRFSIIPSFKYNSLCTYLKEISNLSDITITYLDEEGDSITIGAEDEFTEAKRALDVRSILALQLTVTAGPNARPFKKADQETQPQPTPRSAPSRPGKWRRGGHYAELADEVREKLLINTPTQPQAMSRASQTGTDLKNTLVEMKKTDNNTDMERSSEWRNSFVTKASQEITNVLESLLHSPENEPSSLFNPSPNGTCHIGVKCIQCNKTIVGNRYKCGNCADYDVCELCLLRDAHDPTHVFLLLRVPCPTAGYREGRAVPILSDNIYRPGGRSEESLSREQPDRLAFGTQTCGLNKKLKKVIKMEKKMKKVIPRYVEAQVDLNSDIQHLRKRIEDMSDRMRTTATIRYSPPLVDESSHQTSPPPLSQAEYSAVVVRDKEACAVLPPCARFCCKWLVENNGTLFWTSVRFHCVSGNLIPAERQVSLPVCSPGEQIELEIPFSSPDEEGYYYSQWRLSHHGKGFGPTLKAECRVSYQQLVRGKNVEVDSGAEDDEDLASADQGFALRAFPGAGGLQQPLIAISHEDYIDESLLQANPTCDADSIDLDATELIQDDSILRAASPLYSDQEFLPEQQPLFANSSTVYTPNSAASNSDTASVTSSSADSFIVVQMPDSFDPNQPIYLRQGSETVPASVLLENVEVLHEDTPEFSSPIATPEPISLTAPPAQYDHSFLSRSSTSYSPQPNVNITCLSTSPMSSIKSFVSSVVDRLDESLTRSPTPKHQPELFASTHEDFQFEVPSCPSPEHTTTNPFLAQFTAPEPDAFVPFDLFDSTSSFSSSTFLPTDTAEFQFEIPPTESFLPKKEDLDSLSGEAFVSDVKEQWLSNEFQMNPHAGIDSESWIAKESTTPSAPLDFFSNCEEAWIAPSTNWKPKTPSTPLDHLMKMGFCNREMNSKLLEKHNGRLEQVIEALIEDTNVPWPVNNI